MPNRKIVLTGGGTAGHVMPNLALIPGLKKEGFDIAYIYARNGMEKVLKYHTPVHRINEIIKKVLE